MSLSCLMDLQKFVVAIMYKKLSYCIETGRVGRLEAWCRKLQVIYHW